MLTIDAERHKLLRDLLMRGMSTWKRQHVFGDAEMPGVPNMPLEEIYVEPEGIFESWQDDDDEASPRREPICGLIRDLLTKHKIVIVQGDFGRGKSLTARTLACAWAETYLTDRTTPSPELVYPVFIKCEVDFAHHEPSLAKVFPRAFRNQAAALKIDLTLDDLAFARPSNTEKVVYLVDGLDEVGLTPIEVDAFFRDLDEHTGERHRAIVFSREGVIPEQEKLNGIPVIHMQDRLAEAAGRIPVTQISAWLEKWNRLSGNAPITADQLAERGLLPLMTNPLLLFMSALTWDVQPQRGRPLTRADVYERFFLHRFAHLHEVEMPQVENEKSISRSLTTLWLMGRVAWEWERRAHVGCDLTMHEVTTLLREELHIEDSKTAELTRVGVLRVLQADLHGGDDRILFRHESFREFLVAHYWASQLRGIVTEQSCEKRAELERKLLGARLMGAASETFYFLVLILESPAWDELRERLFRWANDCFNDEVPCSADGTARSWIEDQRPALREAALAIGSRVRGSRGLSARHASTLRTMLAAFWLSDTNAIVIAPQLESAGANLSNAVLPMARLQHANLHGAQLYNAHLCRAALTGASLTGANLMRADLREAGLVEADLVDTNLMEADLRGADLTGANLTGANLTGAKLDPVYFNEGTRWPAGFSIPGASASAVEGPDKNTTRAAGSSVRG